MKRAINRTRCFRGAFQTFHAFLRGFRMTLLLHVGKGALPNQYDDLLHIRVKDIRIAKQGNRQAPAT